VPLVLAALAVALDPGRSRRRHPGGALWVAAVKITLTDREGHVMEARLPYPGATYVEIDYPCSGCGSKAIAGGAPSIESHDTYRAQAACVGCKAACGVLRVQLSTLFGLEEDEAVLHGRPRVY
jgi:hypothetical protein